MDAEKIACSALRGDKCFNGFYVTAACHGIGADHVRPTCCNEERCAHLYGDAGWPNPSIMRRRKTDNAHPDEGDQS